MSDEQSAYAESSGDYDGITVWKTKPSDEVLESERTKQALLKLNEEDRFGEDDPRSDDEMWSAYRSALGEEDA